MADEENQPASHSDSDSDDEFFDALASEEKSCNRTIEKGNPSAGGDNVNCPTVLTPKENCTSEAAEIIVGSTGDRKPEAGSNTDCSSSSSSSKTEDDLQESCTSSTERVTNTQGDACIIDNTGIESKQAMSPDASIQPISTENKESHDGDGIGAESEHFLDASETSDNQPALIGDQENVVTDGGDALEGVAVEEKETEEIHDGEENKVEEEVVVDEEEMRREREDAMTEEEREGLREEAQTHKARGNSLFKQDEFLDAISAYTEALEVCPLCYKKERSVMFGNRAVCRLRRDQNERAIEDCNKSLELQPNYLKVWLRRANTYELMEKLDEALADFKQVLELDPSCYEARAACMRLPGQINERNEKLKEEMFGKLKDLGNLVLRPFGLSTENFQMQQDPNTGGYSVNFRQNATSGNGRP